MNSNFNKEKDMMQFHRIDVRQGLLSNSFNRGARHVEQVDIDFSTARSENARKMLERGQGQSRMYNVDAARRSYCEAAELARRDKDGFVEAAAGMLLTMLMDGMTNSNSQPHFMESALAALDYEIFCLSEQFLADAAKREVTVPILHPRNTLRDLIVDNLAQYKFRQDSLLIADTKTNIDRHLAAGDWNAAANVSKIGAENAGEMFGQDHWWVGVMLVRRATALLRMQQLQMAQPLVQRAAFIFQEWTDFTTDGGGFKNELGILTAAQSDIKLLLAS
jgi:hypothetical protein